MQYCRKCLYPANHPLGIIFDEEGVCSGCKVHDEKYHGVNWEKKESEFNHLLDQYRGKFNSFYDCVIPVVGNGDDFFVVDLVKNKFGLNPLLVTYNSQFNTEVGVRNLARLLTKLDCDHIQYTVSPETVRAITRYTLERLGHAYWHVVAGQLTFPVQVGTKFNIPLIVWGVHSWSDQVGMFSHLDNVEMTKKVRKEHGLKMLDADLLSEIAEHIPKKDLIAFSYPSNEQLEKCRVRGIYVSNYFVWDSQTQTEAMIEKYGYETHPQERTFNTYETIHCHVCAGVHDYIKYLKYGFGKATDHASRDIRFKRISRIEGIKLVEKYDHVKPRDFQSFLNWAQITEEEFFSFINPHRDLNVWGKNNSGEYFLKTSVSSTINEGINVEPVDPKEYKKTSLLEPNSEKFILTGRTYMDEFNYKAIEG